jgi:hypothetical protein
MCPNRCFIISRPVELGKADERIASRKSETWQDRWRTNRVGLAERRLCHRTGLFPVKVTWPCRRHPLDVTRAAVHRSLVLDHGALGSNPLGHITPYW